MADKLAAAKVLVQRLAGYHFRNEDILMEAIDTTGQRISQSNQRLALLGDAVLQHALLDDWYPNGTPKGNGNAILSTVANNPNLAAVARRHGLDALVVTNPGHCGPLSTNTLATIVEALIGAVYLDSGKDLDTVKLALAGLELTPSNMG
ncbi:hypothetical protein LTR36_002870 [Oleoguttula mirabilis]|uniref:RNase III domain-containing protein n=1 Tax=Oleoguttula mirabilis TaxID=1507867 RepID=A0AAV9JLY7_9PEZI|nr:hypothetical protein LTR36_002870 [Oleoguttula mirabilis]